MLVIMDMDFTLVDTSNVDPLRRARQWSAALSKLKDTDAYSGVNEMVDDLQANGHEVIVLTNSPSNHAMKLIEIHELKIGKAYYYKDLNVPRKPDPGGHLSLLKKTNTIPTDAVSIGDDPNDRIAAQGAGIRFIAAMWGTKERTVANQADAVANQPEEVYEIIERWSN